MRKQKTGFWKTHPLLKAITVLVGFFLLLNLLYLINVPIIADLIFTFYYLGGGIFILGGIYGIWLDRGCHLKIASFCLILLVMIIVVSISYSIECIYPFWKINRYVDWEYLRPTIIFIYSQILCTIGCYILSKVISYFARKDRKTEETSI
jgi:hypothetical protein